MMGTLELLVILAFFLLLTMCGGPSLDPAEVAAVSATCQAKGMVAKVDKHANTAQVYCEKVEEK